ncbi:MAG: xylulokinase [Oscillospiraceae bacterium]|nr:xylulokinase [Oscillospiraceae bacterium]
MYYLGIDIGTSSVKILAADRDCKEIVTESRDYNVYYPRENWVEQDACDWWEGTKDAIKALAGRIDISKVRSVSFSGQMHGMVALDGEGNPLRRAVLWCDGRTEVENNYLNNDIGRERLTEYTGNQSFCGFTAPKILWLRNNEPENYNKAKMYLLPKDYIIYRMSGKYATDVSDASGTLYFDVAKRCWSKPMLDILGITEDQLPAVYESYEVVGNIDPDVADQLGLSHDVKIVAGAGDQAAAAVGVGATNAGVASASLGTSGVIFVSSDRYSADSENRLHSFAHANGRWHQMGVILSAALSQKWWIKQILGSQYDPALDEAEKSPAGSNNLLFAPYLNGERTPHNDPNVRGAFIGLSSTTSQGDMTRAMLEGVAFALRDTYEILREMGIDFQTVRLSGGGTKAPLWIQIIADVLGKTAEIIETNEGSALGAAILAMVGAGEYPTVDSACENNIKVSKRVEPIQENIPVYDRQYAKFKGVYGMLSMQN